MTYALPLSLLMKDPGAQDASCHSPLHSCQRGYLGILDDRYPTWILIVSTGHVWPLDCLIFVFKRHLTVAKNSVGITHPWSSAIAMKQCLCNTTVVLQKPPSCHLKRLHHGLKWRCDVRTPSVTWKWDAPKICLLPTVLKHHCCNLPFVFLEESLVFLLFYLFVNFVFSAWNSSNWWVKYVCLCSVNVRTGL